MSTVLPELTRKIDNAFVTTWYEIRKEAVDNILNATVTWSALVGAGCMKPKVGGEFLTRTIRYGEAPEPVAVKKGSTLPMGETELETMAIWDWKYLASHVQRSMIDDQKNNGPDKIKDLVGMRLQAARDALEQKFEKAILQEADLHESGIEPLGLNDLIPPASDRTTGTYGRIQRPSAYTSLDNGVEVPDPEGTNHWWGPKYKPWVGAREVNLLQDMNTMYNSIHNNQSPPNLIIGTQDLFEIYQDFALDKSQIIKDETTRLADLGFEVCRFKGKPFIWTNTLTVDNMLMLNTDYIEIVYDPTMFFAMTEWKQIPLQLERVAHIMNTYTVLSDQLRRHGRLYPAS